ncbi:hypothetical protein PIB30_075197 [Stylosanthes scabra]|uniref:Uncharacterized protein n=1 Tax=Stylosanthes scabra TaxID=79078 RepID=A0ABU6YMF0_9FABA|nr:hypothetical protein [Stylosanthes scabra]
MCHRCHERSVKSEVDLTKIEAVKTLINANDIDEVSFVDIATTVAAIILHQVSRQFDDGSEIEYTVSSSCAETRTVNLIDGTDLAPSGTQTK